VRTEHPFCAGYRAAAGSGHALPFALIPARAGGGVSQDGVGQLVPPVNPPPLTLLVAVPLGAMPPLGVLLPCTKLTGHLHLQER
jgi:hypothetical protein